ncbi:histidine phosphatase family protein [Lentilactobacillus kefiri]|uniref:Phosphoglycerate mutase n=3 Tax=Bacilli TaxID=91061 RepID=A0A8E1RHL3_LENKE|nr:histidine phosphatase family protein [Lentilactobacillus kefiri]KRL73461.1 phosphoglycerate mutase [Lentilactobacillus parakefiri DSM 10551]KRM49680.1 phosphoglycerate mutase [Lentilactobacillus kefiri DSM 20587 = JCM 5818]MCJ2162472.1 histidine phosphatase family protein [Lentilactobacillus kefiri]MCP9369702.1 histidine phosphatase family protein [Lentilactobacillus kefiri]MDH5109460.1 histidine phosphatase family protein [Lentilactobacillus kefiri]
MTDFYFVRHGQTAANAAGLKQGTINTEITYLSETGKKQAESLRKGFDISFADQIIASPLQRTKDTAAILNRDANLPVTYDKRLLEISYGSWDGEKNADLMSKYPELFDHVLNDALPTYAAVADGETFSHVIDRIDAFMTEVSAKYPDQKIVLITHGFTIKAAVLAAIGRPTDMMVIEEPDNTSVTRITRDVSNNSYYLRYYNRVVNSHF